MNASKAMTRSRYTAYSSRGARNLIPHSIAIAAAFAFVSALVLGAL
ncbi:hypothetical protein [Sinorhizobium saheli]|nr:hypothetical protein [Sinorhizobium saheli]